MGKGYNTRIAMELLAERKEGWYYNLDNDQAAILVVIFWGANDAAIHGIQGIPVDEYKNRLKEQIQQVRSTGNLYSQRVYNKSDENFTKVILVTPPPVDDEKWLKERKDKAKLSDNLMSKEDLDNIGLDRDHKTTGIYANAAKEIANECNCPVIDLYNDMQKKESFSDYLNDGLHFSSAGNDFMFKSLRGTIKKTFPELVPENITKGNYLLIQYRNKLM